MNRFLISICASILLAFGLFGASMPNELPTTPAALIAYANFRAAHVSIGISGRLVADPKEGDSYVSLNTTEGSAEAINQAIGSAELDFGVVNPAVKLYLSIAVYDKSWKQLYTFGDYRGVVNAKGGGYNLDDYTYKLYASKVPVNIGQKIHVAELVYVDDQGYISDTVSLKVDENGSCFYVSEEDLARPGAFIRIYAGEKNWEEYFYGPDGVLIAPEDTQVQSLNGEIDGVRILKGAWQHLVIPTSEGHGKNIVTEFHPTSTGLQVMTAVTSEGKVPISVVVESSDGQYEVIPTITEKNGYVTHNFVQGLVYQVYYNWNDGDLIEEGAEGNNGFLKGIVAP